MLAPFTAYIYKLKHIPRWNLKHNMQPENVKEHSFDVATIAHMIAEIHNTIDEDKLDTGKIALYALYHDATEVLTGDLPTPVKYSNQEISDAYNMVEEKASEKLLLTLPENLKSRYNDLLNYKDNEDKRVYTIIKCSDLIAAYVKAEYEIQMGNKDFKAARDRIKYLLEKYNTLPAIDQFLKNHLPTYWIELEEFEINK